MKQCYFCNQSIPMDAKKCPMSGMDVTEEQSTTSEIENQTYNINFNPVSRKEEKRFNFLKSFSTFSQYLHYLTRKVTHPQETDLSLSGSSLYGYLTILLSALLAAGTATRVAATWDQTYQTLASISILPVVSFSFNAIEWFMKLSLFFFVYAYLYGFISFIFQKNQSEEEYSFAFWLTHFGGMNALSLFVLGGCFILSLIAPLALGIPALIFIFLYLMSYTLSFALSLGGTNINKRYYQGIIASSIHFLLLLAFGYLLVKI